MPCHSTNSDVHLDIAMYGMLHASLISETQARRELEAAQSRAAAIARELRAVARAQRRAHRAYLRADRASISLRQHEERVIDLRDSELSSSAVHKPPPW